MVAKRIVILFGAIFWVYFLAALSCAADPMLRSEISPELGSLDDLYLFTVTLDDYQDRVNPQLSTSADFSVELLGPKTSISIINGAVRSQQAFVYQLTPKRSGNLKTPEAQVAVSGKILSAPPINVSISPMANTQPTDPQAGTTNPPPNQQLFMTQTASPEGVYVGQQIVNSIGVFTQVNLKGVRINDDTSDGFWQETISDGQNGQRELNGKEYATIHISRALFPLRPGTLVIPARQGIAQVPVTRQSNPLSGFDPFSADFFDNFFQRTVVQERKMQSNEVTIDAVALPAPPADIKQFLHGLTIVGNTSLSLEYSDTPLNVGESKNITVRIIREGHLNPLKFLPLAPPSGVKVYEGQSLVRHNTHGGKLITEKTFTYSIVPVRSGMLRIPGAALAYFDPYEKKYRVASSKDIVIVSSGSTSLPENPGDNNPPEQIDNSSRDTLIASPIPTLPPVAIAPPLE